MSALGLIIQREFSSRVKTRAFILTTLLTPFLFIAVTALPALLMKVSDNDNIKKVYVIDQTGMYSSLFKTSGEYEFIILSDGDTSQKEKATALLQITDDLSVNPQAATFFSEKQQPPRELTAYINNTLSEAVKNKKVDDFTAQSNLEPQVVADMQALLKSKERVSISTIRWDETGQETETMGEAATFIGMALTFCMFFFIMMYGSMVMQSVVEEKTNRIIEVIISSVKPFDLMMGKIIGVGLVGLLQLAVWLVLCGGAMVAVQLYVGIDINTLSAMDTQQAASMMQAQGINFDLNSPIVDLFKINWIQVIACLILYFIGGYILFASLFAMFGSGANDSQEAQQLIMPVMVILMVAFYTGFAAAKNSEGAMAFWCSLIPFTSPVVMMVRAPFEIPLWELALSVVLLFATAILMVKLAAKIYRVGILMFGKKVSFIEMFKWLEYK